MKSQFRKRIFIGGSFVFQLQLDNGLVVSSGRKAVCLKNNFISQKTLNDKKENYILGLKTFSNVWSFLRKLKSFLLKDSNPLPAGYLTAVAPHVCFIQDANKFATKNMRGVGKLWKMKKTPLLSCIFSLSKNFSRPTPLIRIGVEKTILKISMIKTKTKALRCLAQSSRRYSICWLHRWPDAYAMPESMSQNLDKKVENNQKR